MKKLSKKNSRLKIKQKHQTISKRLIEDKSYALSEAIKLLPEYRNATKIAIFMSMEYEFNTTFLLKDKQKKFFIPKIIDENMEFYLYEENFTINHYGIKEPQSNVMIRKNEIDLMIVPYVGFNQSGFRLGHGKGYYDKYLESSSITTILPGISEFLIDFEEESHDQKVDIILIY